MRAFLTEASPKGGVSFHFPLQRRLAVVALLQVGAKAVAAEMRRRWCGNGSSSPMPSVFPALFSICACFLELFTNPPRANRSDLGSHAERCRALAGHKMRNNTALPNVYHFCLDSLNIDTRS